MSELLPSLYNSIFNDEVLDVIKDYSEIAYDSIMEEGILKEIPVVKTVVAVCKTGLNIKERNFIRQTIVFLQQFNSGDLSDEKIIEHHNLLNTNPHILEKEMNVLINFLSENTEEELSKISGRIYLAYLRGALSWDKLLELIEVNRRMFIGDYKILKSINSNNILSREKYRYGRLIGLGLVVEYDSPASQNNNIYSIFYNSRKYNRRSQLLSDSISLDYQITPLGKTLLQFIDWYNSIIIRQMVYREYVSFRILIAQNILYYEWLCENLEDNDLNEDWITF